MDASDLFRYTLQPDREVSLLAVSFCKCDCGLELKLLQELDLKKQVYTCACGRKFDFLGTIVEIYTAPAGAGFTRGAEWKPVLRHMKASG
jgi:hypothetical protein